MQTQIIGLGIANVNYAEYTSWDLLTAFNNAVTPLAATFQTPSGSTAAQYTQSYNSIIQQIGVLKNLAQNGVTINTGTTTYPSYLNEQMVTSLNDVMRTLAIAGIPPPAGSPPLTPSQQQDAILTWQALPQFGIDVAGTITAAQNIFSNASSYTVPDTNPVTGLASTLLVKAFPTRSLQSALELEYVSYGNQLISTELLNQQSALNVTQQVLNTLTNAQNFLNQITVQPTQPQFTFPPTNAADPPNSTLFQQILSFTNPAYTSYGNIIANQILNESTSNLFAQTLNTLYHQGNYFVVVDINNENADHTPLVLTSATTNSQILAAYGSDAVSLVSGFIDSTIAIPALMSAAVADFHNTSPISITQTALNQAGPITDPNTFYNAYKKAASAYFSQLFPSTAILNVSNAALQLSQIKSLLLQEVAQLSALSPGNGRTVAGSLANNCFAVALDISSVFKNVNYTKTSTLQAQLLSSVKTYILDGQNKTLSALSTSVSQVPFENNVTNALTNASSVEQTQQENIKRYVFIFQQFYKTSAAMLTALEQLFESIAQGIDSG